MPARVVTVAIILMLLGRPTRAALTAFWRNNPITPQAIADDPTLASMQSWSVMVSNTEGMWTSAGLRATLPHPTRFYRNPIGGPSRPSTAEQAAHPALTFHTYVTQPIQAPNGLSPPTVLGGFPDAKKLPASVARRTCYLASSLLHGVTRRGRRIHRESLRWHASHFLRSPFRVCIRRASPRSSTPRSLRRFQRRFRKQVYRVLAALPSSRCS